MQTQTQETYKTPSNPSFPGGKEAFQKYISDNFKPTGNGKLVVSFIIERDGQLTNIEIVEGINKKTDKRIIKVLKKSPLWIPGEIDGKPVRAKYNLPMTISNAD